VVVAVSVTVVEAAGDWRVVAQFAVYRRHETPVVGLLDAEREHALGHRHAVPQLLRHHLLSTNT